MKGANFVIWDSSKRTLLICFTFKLEDVALHLFYIIKQNKRLSAKNYGSNKIKEVICLYKVVKKLIVVHIIYLSLLEDIKTKKLKIISLSKKTSYPLKTTLISNLIWDYSIMTNYLNTMPFIFFNLFNAFFSIFHIESLVKIPNSPYF